MLKGIYREIIQYKAAMATSMCRIEMLTKKTVYACTIQRKTTNNYYIISKQKTSHSSVNGPEYCNNIIRVRGAI